MPLKLKHQFTNSFTSQLVWIIGALAPSGTCLVFCLSPLPALPCCFLIFAAVPPALSSCFHKVATHEFMRCSLHISMTIGLSRILFFLVVRLVSTLSTHPSHSLPFSAPSLASMPRTIVFDWQGLCGDGCATRMICVHATCISYA